MFDTNAPEFIAGTELYHSNYQEYLPKIPATVWERWEAHKDEYYRQCQKVIDYAVYYYSSRTPMTAAELKSRANLIFCIACLRWDPNGSAALPTYVATQLRRLSGTDIRVEAKHRNNRTAGHRADDEDSIDLLTLIGKPDEGDSLREYVERAGKDPISLYDKCISGWYARNSNSGTRRPITARALHLSHVMPWTCKERYEQALGGIREAAKAWRSGEDFKGYAVISRGTK